MLADWAPGCLDEYLKLKYRAGIERRLVQLDAVLAEKTGVAAMALAPIQERLSAWSRSLRQTLTPSLGLDVLRGKYHQLAVVKEAADLAGRVRSVRLAVEDQRSTMGDRYPKGDAYLARVDAMEKAAAVVVASALASSGAPPADLVALETEFDKASAEILLANPLLDFDKLLVVRGSPGFQTNWDGPNHLGSDLVVVSPVRPDGKQTLLHHEGRISDFDLNWDGQRILFSDGRALFEINADGTGLRQVSAKDPPVWHYDGCYLPNGQIACVSNACEQAVPCTGGAERRQPAHPQRRRQRRSPRLFRAGPGLEPDRHAGRPGPLYPLGICRSAALLLPAAVPHEPGRLRPDGVLPQQLVLAERDVSGRVRFPVIRRRSSA